MTSTSRRRRPTRSSRRERTTEAWQLAYALRDYFGNIEDAFTYAWARHSPVWGVGDEWVRLEWGRVMTRLRWLDEEAETDRRATEQKTALPRPRRGLDVRSTW
jgi:hypothetical protein